MEAVLPKSVDYLDVLPKAVPSERKRRKYYPANGTQYLAGGTVIIEVADNRLVCAILEPCTNGHRMSAQKSITGQSNYGNTQQTIVPVQAGNLLTIQANGTVTGDQFAGSKYNNANNIAAGASQNLSAPLFGGLFSQWI